MKQFTPFVAMLALALSAAAQDYKTTVIYQEPNLRPGSTQLNNAGEVAGSYISSSGASHMFRWSKTDKLQDLGTLGGSSSGSTAINDAGEIVGGSLLPEDKTGHAVFWSPATGLVDIGGFGGFTGYAVGINNSSQVTGLSYLRNNQIPHAFFWSPSGGLQDIGDGVSSEGIAINGNGQVVGLLQDRHNRVDGFLWSQTGGFQVFNPTAFGDTATVGVSDSGLVAGNFSSGHCLIGEGCGFVWSQSGGFQLLTLNGTSVHVLYENAAGTVVGYVNTTAGTYHIFLWTQNSGVQDLGVLPGRSYSYPYALNNKGEVLGVSCKADGVCRGFVWRPGQGMKAIPDSDNSSRVFTKINDAGQLIGVINNAETVLLSPWVHVKLASSQNPSKLGQSVTFTAAASSVEGVPKDGELVTFKVGNRVLGSVPLVAGVATFTASSFAVGTHAVTATYAGDVNYDAQKSGALQQVVTP